MMDWNVPSLPSDTAKREVSRGLIHKIVDDFSDGILFSSASISSLRTNEVELVRGVLQALQGLSSTQFYWDRNRQKFCAKSGVYVTHLTRTSLHVLLNQFMYYATCLKHVEFIVDKLETSVRSPPTLRAFSSSVSGSLKRLRDIAVKEETKINSSDIGVTPTLLGLLSSLSSVCSGAEYLLQIVHGAIPNVYFESPSSIQPAEIAVHILDYLYKQLDEVSLVQGGEEGAYQMLLYIFASSLLPYIEGLDSWVFEGTLHDPFEEMFFYASKEISVDEKEFWEKSCLLRCVQNQVLNLTLANDSKQLRGSDSVPSSSVKLSEQKDKEVVCPSFIKDLVKPIVSAGKSLKLLQHVPSMFPKSVKSYNSELCGFGDSEGDMRLSKSSHCPGTGGLSLSEVFCISLAGLMGHGDHVSGYFWKDGIDESDTAPMLISDVTSSERTWSKFYFDTLLEKGVVELKCGKSYACHSAPKEGAANASLASYCPENPAITVSKMHLEKNKDAWKALKLSHNAFLPPLNDDSLWKAVFGEKSGVGPGFSGTDYSFGFQFGQSEYLRSQSDTNVLEALFPFPTLLPFIQDDQCLSELLPFQKNSTLASKVLSWIQYIEPRSTQLPLVIIQECLTVHINRQVDYVGGIILSKLMNEWRLMDELAVLRAIYLLGSGDLLQHFLTIIFCKLDKSETWADDFELNTILQESIRSSADGMLLSAPDSLVVSIAIDDDIERDEQHNTVSPRKSRPDSSGIDALRSLKFTYKVSWPLELVASNEAIKKYNQVMGFLLKVKRAKFVLDKARRWMWKGRSSATTTRKHHWLVEQKLLHFVDAFHQYVMDRVYHSAWRELCEAMATARSLDAVIEVHEAYLLTIQRQCFVVPEKLWAIIASRINIILGLALDFYSIQQTLSSGGAISAIKARCEIEIDRIEKQFDDCIAFLLRVLSSKLNVGHFPHLADLVTRINYNYFYMSDGGNLKTVLGSETVPSRPWKPSSVRPF